MRYDKRKENAIISCLAEEQSSRVSFLRAWLQDQANVMKGKELEL